MTTTIYSTNTGAGAEDGTSLADAYEHMDALSAMNSLGVLGDDYEWRLCADDVYTLTSSMKLQQDGSITYPITMRGRNADDTDDAVVVLDANGGSFHAMDLFICDYWRFANIEARNTAATYRGWNVSANADYTLFYRCGSRGCSPGNTSGHGFYSAAAADFFMFCYAIDCGGYGFSGCTDVYGCVAGDNGGVGIFNSSRAVESISYGSGGAGMYNAYVFSQCIAYGNTTDGFATAQNNVMISDCISVGNGAYGFDLDDNGLLHRCTTYNNTSGRIRSNSHVDIEPITLSDDPFTDAANGDFSWAGNSSSEACRQLRHELPGIPTVTYDSLGPYTQKDVFETYLDYRRFVRT